MGKLFRRMFLHNYMWVMKIFLPYDVSIFMGNFMIENVMGWDEVLNYD